MTLGYDFTGRELAFRVECCLVLEQVEFFQSNVDQKPEVFDWMVVVTIVLTKSHRFHPTGPPHEARLPGFLVPALTLSSSASVVDAAAEMTTLVEVLLKSWFFIFFHGRIGVIDGIFTCDTTRHLNEVSISWRL